MVLAAARAITLAEPSSMAVMALHVGARIDTRTLEGRRVDPTAVVVEAGPRTQAVVFRFGSVVMFGGTELEQRSLLARLTDCIREPYSEPETEEARIALDSALPEGPNDNAVILHDTDADRLTTVADVLAKSVALARYEQLVAEVFGEVDALARSLERTGRPPSRSRTLTRRIGAALLMETQIVGRAEVDEKPEMLWERPDLERLWELLVSEYELRERSRAVSRKLELVARANGTVLDLVQTRRSLRVEILIVLLIVLEVAITVYELATG